MTSKPALRPGGRSARVQAAVHQATRALLAQHERADLNVPLIATHAGVTPSTIYRRWGTLADLLADVAVERLRPESDPSDTGSFASDLHNWAEQYLEEMSSDIGLAMLRDVLSATPSGEMPVPCRCAEFTASQIATMVARGAARGEPVPDVETVMDGVVAPIIYRVLFGAEPPTHERVRALVDACLRPESASRVHASNPNTKASIDKMP